MSWSVTFKSLLDSAVYGQARPSFIVTSGLHCKLTKNLTTLLTIVPEHWLDKTQHLAMQPNKVKQSQQSTTQGQQHSRQSKLRLLIYHNTLEDYLMLS